MKSTAQEVHQEHKVADYYRFHSQIYDYTRWSFLFGREKLLTCLPDLPPNPRILEIGCGTGKNIELLEYLFPDGRIYGIDLSKSMLNKAQQRAKKSHQITLINKAYGSDNINLNPFDLILLSYSLTMVGEKTELVLQQVYKDLKPKGHIAVVDFNNTPHKWFQTWMRSNHVTINGHLLPLLNKYYTPCFNSVNNAYLGLWKYFMFIGKCG